LQDNLETSAHFATAIYSISKPEFLPAALSVFNEGVKQQQQLKDINDLYPVYMTGNLYMDPRLNDFSTYVASTAWNVLSSQGYKMDDKITYFHSMWGQQHHKSSNMEEHTHNDGVQIVGFYFLDCPDNSSQMIFADPRIGKMQLGIIEADPSKISMSSDRISFKPEVGKLYLTNAWLAHAFSRHGNDKPFKFIHMNLSVQQAPTSQATVI
jgi:hypothetical protein